MPGPYRVLGLDLTFWKWVALSLVAFIVFDAVFPEVVIGYALTVQPIYQVIRGYVGLMLSWAFAAYLLPVGLVYVAVFDLLGLSRPQWLAPFQFVALVVLSWIFWTTLYVRTARLFGLWDPFARVDYQGRRFVLRGMVRLKEWWEAQRQFGKGPTARLAGLVEVLSNRYLRGDVFLGRPKLPIGGLMRPIGIPTEKHMVTIAEPGAGKSTAALIPNLCIHQGSLLCIDPKGELATITAQRRGAGGSGVEGMGQGVFVLDPFGTTALPGESAAYNVFDELARVAEYDADRPVSYAGLIADALVHRRDGQEAAYWDNAAHTLVRGLVLYILAHEPPERRHLVRLRQLLMEGDIDGHAEAVAAGAIKAGDLTPFDVLVERMREARDGPYGEAIAGAASSLITMSPNQMGGVVTTAQEHTAFLDAPEIARLCRHSDFLLEDLKTSWISVYLCMPVTMVSGKEGRWLRMFVLLFIDMMVRVPAPPPIPVLLAIDEFPSLGRLEGIDVVAPVLRSYGVRFWAIAQDVGQLERVYKDVWGGFIGGAEAVQFMGIKHPDTVKLVVSLLGEHEVKRQRTDGRQWRTSEEVKPVLDAEQVSRLLNPRNGNQIVWRGSRRPLLLKTTPYFKYLPARYYSPDPRYPEAWNRRWWREAS